MLSFKSTLYYQDLLRIKNKESKNKANVNKHKETVLASTIGVTWKKMLLKRVTQKNHDTFNAKICLHQIPHTSSSNVHVQVFNKIKIASTRFTITSKTLFNMCDLQKDALFKSRSFSMAFFNSYIKVYYLIANKTFQAKKHKIIIIKKETVTVNFFVSNLVTCITTNGGMNAAYHQAMSIITKKMKNITIH